MIVTFPKYSLLGSLTTKQLIGLIRATLNENDNQRLQDLAIRLYINSAKDELQDKILSTTNSQYDYIFHAKASPIVYTEVEDDIELEYDEYNTVRNAHTNNKFRLEKIDLGQSITYSSYATDVLPFFFGLEEITPTSYLKQIKSVAFLGHGTGTRVSYDELMNIAHTQSDIWRHSLVWAFVGSSILVYNGAKTVDVDSVEDADAFRETLVYEIMATRRPHADDLLFPANSNTYNVSVDIPADSYKLLVMMTQRSCLEALGKTALPQIEQSTENLAMAKTQGKVTNMQLGL